MLVFWLLVLSSWVCSFGCWETLCGGRQWGGKAIPAPHSLKCETMAKHLESHVVEALDRLIDQAVTSGHEYAQLWFYIQVERGEVRQVGVSPVAAVSIRFSDGGRQRARADDEMMSDRSGRR